MKELMQIVLVLDTCCSVTTGATPYDTSFTQRNPLKRLLMMRPGRSIVLVNTFDYSKCIGKHLRFSLLLIFVLLADCKACYLCIFSSFLLQFSNMRLLHIT